MAEKLITDLTAKATPVDADETVLVDSAASLANKKVTFVSIYNYLKSKFDTVYLNITTASTTYVPLATYDANTILYATTDNTPVALTVGTNTVVGRVAGAITTLAVDADLTSVSASDDTVPSAKATKTALDLKAPIASPTFTGTVAIPASTYSGISTYSSSLNEFQGADIVSATTTNIGAATGNYINVTGTTTITGLGTIQAGTRRIVTFTGALTLTHNATSLILPTGASIVTVAGDVAQFISLGAGNWKCITYQRASGAALSGGGSGAMGTGRQAIASSITGTSVFAHGMGRTPTAVDFEFYEASTLSQSYYGSGAWSSTNGNFSIGGLNAVSFASSTYSVYIGDTTTVFNGGAISVDGTNITITWTKTGSPSLTFNILWSAR